MARAEPRGPGGRGGGGDPGGSAPCGKDLSSGASACLFKCHGLHSRPGARSRIYNPSLPLRRLLLPRPERELPPPGSEAASFSSRPTSLESWLSAGSRACGREGARC